MKRKFKLTFEPKDELDNLVFIIGFFLTGPITPKLVLTATIEKSSFLLDFRLFDEDNVEDDLDLRNQF
jgi:hypothetical protein